MKLFFQSKMLKIASFLTFLILASPTYGDWQAELEKKFDVVETFDNLQDWTPQDSWYGDVFISDLTQRPQLTSGGPSRWGYVSKWTHAGFANPVICNHGPGTAITGKSARIDMGDGSNGGLKGIGRLGMYWGDGTPTSGHRDMYAFYRFKIPRNHFPTRTSESGTGIGTYVLGEPLTYIGYEKFHEFMPGFTSNGSWNYLSFTEMSSVGARSPYGASVFVRNLYMEKNGPVERFASANYLYPDGDLKYEFPAYSWPRLYEAGSKPVPLDEWGAVEWHITLRSPAGNDSVEVWHYDSKGYGTRIGGANNLRLQEDDSHALNRMFFGGNSSITYGDGMDSTYYVDDLIIDDKRIGPAYFDLITPSAPSGVRIEKTGD